MNRSSTILFIILALVGSAGFTQVVHAQFYDTFGTSYATQAEATAADARNSASATEANAAAANSATDLKQNPDESYNFVMQKIMTLFAWLVGVAALTLDYAVYYTVVVMGNYIKGLTAVGISWRILRDIGNIMLIFGFLAVGISIILNTERLGYGKKMLPMLLVAAVFMNFSLFFTEAIIDTGNLFATQFFKQINGGNLPSTTSSGALADAAGNAMTTGTEGISNKLMSQLGLQAIYGNASDPDRAKALFKQGSPWLIGFMGILLFIVTAFVLFSLAFILIARFVILIFLIIIAPIGFAGLAIPQLASTAKKWWNMLFQQTITAPVLLLMLYVALMVITDAQFLKGFGVSGPSSADASTGFIGNSNLPGFASFMLSFLVAMGLLIFVTILAKNLSAFGAGLATKTAGSLSFGVAAWGVNRTVGRGMYHLSRVARQNKTFNKFDALTGRVSSRIMDRAATGTMDIRGTGILSKLPGGIDAGKATEGGFVGARKRNIEDHEKAVKAIDTAIEDRNLQKTAAAAQVRAAAEKMHAEATKPLQERIETQKAEVARLEKIVKDNKESGATGFAVMDAQAKLKQAKIALETSDATFKSETARLLQPALDAEKKVGDSIAADKKEAKLAYASGIDHPINNIINPLNLIAYGPRTGEASAKIVKATLKKDTDLEKLAKTVKEMNEKGSDEKKEEKKDESKPSGTGH